MVLLPVARLVPFTVRVAVEVAPDAVSDAVPRMVFPTANVMFPVGAALPLAGFTVATSWVVAVEAILAGVAVTDVVVLTTGAVTVTATDADELAKFPVGV
jgi:hypothetical protein